MILDSRKFLQLVDVFLKYPNHSLIFWLKYIGTLAKDHILTVAVSFLDLLIKYLSCWLNWNPTECTSLCYLLMCAKDSNQIEISVITCIWSLWLRLVHSLRKHPDNPVHLVQDFLSDSPQSHKGFGFSYSLQLVITNHNCITISS